MSLRTRIGAAAIGAVFTVGVAALPAHAADNGADLAKAQKIVTDGINDRLTTLADLQTRLASFKDLGTDTRNDLTTLLGNDVSGLTALKAKVAGETTVAAVRADGKSMVDDYRVYLLVVPEVHLAHALSAEMDAVTKLHVIHDKLADAGADKELLSDMNQQIGAADAAIDGRLAALMALKPGPDGKDIAAAVHGISGAAKDARGDLKKAVEDAKKARQELKGSATAPKS